MQNKLLRAMIIDDDPTTPDVRDLSIAPLNYHRLDPNDLPRRTPAGVIILCVFYGLLALPMFALGAVLLYFYLAGDAPHPRLNLIYGILLIGLGGLLSYWICWYIRNLRLPTPPPKHNDSPE